MQNLHVITSGTYDEYTIWGVFENSNLEIAKDTIVKLSKNNPNDPFFLETYVANAANMENTEQIYLKGIKVDAI